MFKDTMIDLETLGTNPDSPIVSIGAVFFDLANRSLGPTFYMALDVSEQIKRGRKPSGDTIKWWMSQSDAAKKVFHEKAQPAAAVLPTFQKWLRQFDLKKGPYVWGNGSTFDLSMLEDIFRCYDLPEPWGYNKAMDVRTYKRFLAGGAQIPNAGTAHNALDDAIAQAQYIIDHLPEGFNG
jgi:DNA polymerase III epsilon subunit-like protein